MNLVSNAIKFTETGAVHTRASADGSFLVSSLALRSRRPILLRADEVIE
jgi:hypothetical protein